RNGSPETGRGIENACKRTRIVMAHVIGHRPAQDSNDPVATGSKRERDDRFIRTLKSRTDKYQNAGGAGRDKYRSAAAPTKAHATDQHIRKGSPEGRTNKDGEEWRR